MAIRTYGDGKPIPGRPGWVNIIRVAELGEIDEDQERIEHTLSLPGDKRIEMVEILRQRWHGENYATEPHLKKIHISFTEAEY